MWTRLYPILFDVGPTQLIVGVTWQLSHFTISYLQLNGKRDCLTGAQLHHSSEEVVARCIEMWVGAPSRHRAGRDTPVKERWASR
jgi:hypothetical protein